MNIISWNCRGLGNLRAGPSLKHLVRMYNLVAIFLYETLVHSNKVKEFKYMLGFDFLLFSR